MHENGPIQSSSSVMSMTTTESNSRQYPTILFIRDQYIQQVITQISKVL